MVNLLSGNRLELVCREVQFKALYFFLIYTDVELFPDDTSLFSIVDNASVFGSSLNNNPVKIRDWAFNQKILFNLDPTKQRGCFFQQQKFLVFIFPYFLTIH